MFIKKTLLGIILCMFLTYACAAPSGISETLKIEAVFDADPSKHMPAHFRTSNHPLYFREKTGLDQTHMSGSGQFSAINLPILISKIPAENIAVIDLREEPHGFINGLPVSWKTQDSNTLNEGKTLEEIRKDEIDRLKKTLIEKKAKVYRKRKPLQLSVRSLLNEEKLVNSFGLIYIRIPVTDEHKPTPLNVDRFINFVKSLPSNTWLHFHCKMGQGRTTTFMVLYDIIHNAETLSLGTIIRRQYDLGGSNLLKFHNEGTKKHMLEIERLELIKQFYQYRLQYPNLNIPFSDWLNAATIHLPRKEFSSL